MKQTPPPTLEQQIVEALRLDASVDSAALSALITKTNAAIAQADIDAEIERKRALDPQQSPDARAAREAIADSEFKSERLKTLLPRLSQRLSEVEAAEAHRRWVSQYEKMKGRIAAAAERWAEYEDCVSDIIEMIKLNESFASEITRINLAAPSGEPRRLRSPELVARNVPMGTPSILNDLKLPDLDGRVVYPPPQTFDPSLFAPVIASDPRLYTDRWHEVAAEHRAAEAERQQKELVNAKRETDAFYGRPAAE